MAVTRANLTRFAPLIGPTSKGGDARDRLGGLNAFGLLVGLVGVVAIVGVSVEGTSALSLVEIVGVAVCSAVGPAITYVNPAVAAVLRVTILDERFTAEMGVGFALVLAGSALATRASATDGGGSDRPREQARTGRHEPRPAAAPPPW